MMESICFTEDINTYFSSVSAVLEKIDRAELNTAMNQLVDAYSRGTNIYCFGNGGSAATASHMLNDFNKGVSAGLNRKFRFQCLNDNLAILTAIANDIGYADVFLEQMRGKLQPGDMIVAISGSGNSVNVIKGVEYAKSCGCETIGITGYDGGRLRELADYHMHVPVFDMQIVEDIHMIFNHMMMRIFRQELGKRLL
ncbi:MAG: SIS domain-containing protein [Oscillibacter sp.]|nr:SIS domain-containing protein [Oscillibacter sp.]